MSNAAGAYLVPITFFSKTYKKGNFNDPDFWRAEQGNFGKIAATIPHRSKARTPEPGDSGPRLRELEAPIVISTDGLIATGVPDDARTGDEVLALVTNHINSFLATLGLAGLCHTPLLEKAMSHVELSENSLEQKGAVGDAYSCTAMDRALQRYQVPFRPRTKLIDFSWPTMRIRDPAELDEAYKTGSAIVDSLGFDEDVHIHALEAHSSYTLHKWTNCILQGWTFLENVLQKLFETHVVSTAEGKRRKRLNDRRTYTAAVRTEMLFVSGVLPEAVYGSLTELRALRNALSHDGSLATEDEAARVFPAVHELVHLATGIEPGYRSPGWTRAGGWLPK